MKKFLLTTALLCMVASTVCMTKAMLYESTMWTIISVLCAMLAGIMFLGVYLLGYLSKYDK